MIAKLKLKTGKVKFIIVCSITPLLPEIHPMDEFIK